MKNEMQLKAMIKNIAQEKNIQAQAVMQNYMFERLLERISMSDFKDKFILKGGMLVAAMVGLEHRSTMDMDATIRNYPMNQGDIRSAFERITKIDIGDDVAFQITDIEPIREDTDYGGLRVSLEARFSNIKVWLKVDVTTDDVITPNAVRYTMKTMFDDRPIVVWAYNLETIIAEKYETIIRRGVTNTRPRDFYDVYMLLKSQNQNISMPTLLQAIKATAQKRDSTALVEKRDIIFNELFLSPEMHQRWERYAVEYPYVTNTSFDEVLGGVRRINDLINQRLSKQRTRIHDDLSR
jgi:predicted nucleotidyltransferase component of viral defense system